MRVFEKFIFWAGNFLFPRSCALCGESLTGAGEMRENLCEDCRASVALSRDERCGLCGKPLISERDLCLSCREEKQRSYDRLWVLFPYTGKYRKLLTAYKFGKRIALADFLAEKIMEIIAAEPVLKDARIVPVPPRPGKIKENGWDQVDYLVRRLEKTQKATMPVVRCLSRKRSKVQKKLNRLERMENLKGRICMRIPPPQTVLLVDDVVTTGSTIQACSSVLKENGAQKVYGLCLFYN